MLSGGRTLGVLGSCCRSYQIRQSYRVAKFFGVFVNVRFIRVVLIDRVANVTEVAKVIKMWIIFFTVIITFRGALLGCT